MKPGLRATSLAAAFAVAMAGAAIAAPGVVDPEATVVEALVVAARLPGPAWWRVSSPTSTVYVLGAPGALPKGLGWDQSVTIRRLKGANEVILPPTVSVSAGDTVALIGLLSSLRSSAPMEDSLPPALKARFEADHARLGGDPRAYSHWAPSVAALLMVGEWRRKNGLDAAEPAKTVRGLASAAGVKSIPAGTYKALPLFKAVAGQAGEVGTPCLSDALDEIEAGAGPVHAVAEGWARGDVRAALSEPRGYEKCANSFPSGANITRVAMHDTAGAIAEALARPGHSVAVVNLRALLASGGVLQQLQARGFKIGRPDESGD
jgi:TraB/PrgY/gumN family